MDPAPQEGAKAPGAKAVEAAGTAVELQPLQDSKQGPSPTPAGEGGDQAFISSALSALSVVSERRPEKRLLPEPTSNLVSQLFYSWMDPVFRLGMRRPLEASDLFTLSPEYRSKSLTENLQATLRAQAERTRATSKEGEGEKEASRAKQAKAATTYLTNGGVLRSAIFTTIRRPLLMSGGLKLIGDLTNITSPFLVAALINYVSRCDRAHRDNVPLPPLGEGVGYAIGLFFLQFLSTLTTNYHFLIIMKAGLTVRSAVTGAIYQKVFSLSATARQDFSSGRVQNLITTDAARVEMFLQYIHVFWSSPMQIIIISGFLISQIGVAALVGLAFIMLFVPFQGTLFKKLSAIRKRVARRLCLCLSGSLAGLSPPALP
jgi:hypothetical protein